MLSCLTLAAAVKDRAITTIEGLAQAGKLIVGKRPSSNATVSVRLLHSGQILSAVAMLEETAGQHLSDAEIRERLSGNICRCGAYPNIVAAVRQAMGTR